MLSIKENMPRKKLIHVIKSPPYHRYDDDVMNVTCDDKFVP